MTEAQEEQPNPYQTIAERLDSYGIKRIAIIDDAYNVPVRGDFDGEDVLELFFAEVEADQGARDELATMGIEINDVSDISDLVLSRLLAERQNLGALKKHCS